MDGADVFDSLSVEVTDNNLNTANVPVYVDGTENGYMQYNSGVWDYAGQTSVPDFSSGTHNLVATFSDTAGNSKTLTVKFATDATAPAGGSLTIKTKLFPAGITIASPTADIYTLPALSLDGADVFDSLSVEVTDINMDTTFSPDVYVDGIINGKMVYSGSNSIWKYDQLTSVPTFNAGTHNLVATFKDLAGNKKTLTATFTTDATAPVSTASAGSYSYGTWTNNNVTITFDCVDTDGSGCETTPDPFNNQYPYHCIDSTNSCTPDTPTRDVLVSEEGIWYIRYFSRDNAGNTESIQSVQVKIDKTPPAAPSLVSPDDNFYSNTKKPTLAWSPYDALDADRYQFQICNNDPSIGACNQERLKSLTATSRTLTKNLLDGEYWWRARTIDAAANKSDWSGARRITIDTDPPTVPTLSTPANNSTVNGNTLTNDWSDSPESDIHHYVYESYRNETATDLRWSQVVNAPTSQKTATNVANTTFWWR